MRRRSERQSLVVVAAVAAVGLVVVGLVAWRYRVGNDKQVAEAPAAEPTSEQPDDLVTYVVSANVRQWADEVEAAGGESPLLPGGIETIPGLLGQSFSTRAVEGIDYTRPLVILLLQPEKYSHPVVFSGHVADWDDLARSVRSELLEKSGDRVLIGTRSARDRLRGFALGRIADAPGGVMVHVDVDAFLDSPFGAQLTQMLRMASASGGSLQPAEFVQWIRQIEYVQFSAEGANEGRVALTAVPGTALAEFIARQGPSQFGYAPRVDGIDATLLCSGRVEPGDASWMMFEGATGVALMRSDPAMRGRAEAEMNGVLGSEFALAFDLTSGERRAVTVAELGDDPAIPQRIEDWFSWLAQQPSFIVVRPAPTPERTVRGRRVLDYLVTADVARAPDDQKEKLGRDFALGKRALSWTTDGGALVLAGRFGGEDLLARALAETAPDPASVWLAAVETARTSRSSVACRFDALPFLGTPGHLHAFVGFSDREASLRVQFAEP